MLAATGISVWTYGALLGVILTISLALEGRFMFRTAAALLANWSAHIAWWYVTNDPTPFIFSAVVDTATAVTILTRPAGRMQALIGWSLLVQITIHTAYWVNLLVHGYMLQAEQRYWLWLDWIATAQLLLAGGWAVGGLGRRVLDRIAPRRRHRSHADGPAGVARP